MDIYTHWLYTWSNGQMDEYQLVVHIGQMDVDLYQLYIGAGAQELGGDKGAITPHPPTFCPNGMDMPVPP